jgi:hypothetical protein
MAAGNDNLLTSAFFETSDVDGIAEDWPAYY